MNEWVRSDYFRLFASMIVTDIERCMPKTQNQMIKYSTAKLFGLPNILHTSVPSEPLDIGFTKFMHCNEHIAFKLILPKPYAIIAYGGIDVHYSIWACYSKSSYAQHKLENWDTDSGARHQKYALHIYMYKMRQYIMYSWTKCVCTNFACSCVLISRLDKTFSVVKTIKITNTQRCVCVCVWFQWGVVYTEKSQCSVCSIKLNESISLD